MTDAMKVGIVGSSKIPITEETISFVENHVLNYPDDTIFLSGGAKGVDTLVEMVCDVVGRELIIHKPKTDNWEGYKERNLKIAHESDKVICIAIRSKDKDSYCYHCGSEEHERTGGCYTARRCKEFEVKIIDI
jgi:hypothetical protein